MGIYAAVSFKLLPSFNRIMANIQKYRAGVPVVDFIYEELKSTHLNEKEVNLEQNNNIENIRLNQK